MRRTVLAVSVFGILLVVVVGVISVIFFLGERNTLEQFPDMSNDTVYPRMMNIISPAFEHNSSMPSRYTCDGEKISPPLAFSDVQEETQSLALIMDDPDAPSGTFDHWVLWNINPVIMATVEGASMEGDAVIGRNSAGENEYFPPCPPSSEHRYTFKLYALDRQLDLPAGSSKKDVEKAMEGHVLDSAELIGKYQRR